MIKEELERVDDLIYTPAETATIGVESSKKVSTYSEYGIPLGIDGIDGYFAPVMPGQLAVMLGQTSHYKSGLISFLSENAAKFISKSPGRDTKPPAIVFISTEDFIEEQSLYHVCLERSRISQGPVRWRDNGY